MKKIMLRKKFSKHVEKQAPRGESSLLECKCVMKIFLQCQIVKAIWRKTKEKRFLSLLKEEKQLKPLKLQKRSLNHKPLKANSFMFKRRNQVIILNPTMTMVKNHIQGGTKITNLRATERVLFLLQISKLLDLTYFTKLSRKVQRSNSFSILTVNLPKLLNSKTS